MASTYITAADVLHFNDADLDVVVSAILDRATMVKALFSKPAEGNVYRYQQKTAAAGGGFRAANTGVYNVAATYLQKVVTLGILDGSFAVDKGVVAGSKDRAALLAQMGVDHLQASLFSLEQNIVYGTDDDDECFDGLEASASLTVNATGSTPSTGSSVYVVYSGPLDVALIWGNTGEITIGETVDSPISDGDGKSFPGLYTSIVGLSALQVGSTYSVARIMNLTEESGKGLTDDLIAQAIEKFPAGITPTHIFMNRRSQRQLQNSRTAFNPTGAPAVIPVDAFNVPIVVTDAIVNTETIVTVGT